MMCVLTSTRTCTLVVVVMVVVVMVMITTMVTPPLLKWSLMRDGAATEKTDPGT